MTATSLDRPAARWGWRILVTVSGLLVLNGIALYLFIVDTHVERTIGLVLTAFAVFALTVTVEGMRHGSVWCWRASWILVGSLAALAAHSLRAERADVPAFYLVLAAVALVGQMLARPVRAVARR